MYLPCFKFKLFLKIDLIFTVKQPSPVIWKYKYDYYYVVLVRVVLCMHILCIIC